MMRWGIVTTVKAPARAVLTFVAHHLDLGARRAFLYLDAPDPQLATALRAHPDIRVFETDTAWWHGQGGRPRKHQVRQERNAQHAYARANGLDWLAHIDVDEFLCPDRPVADILARVPEDITTARVPPIEALAGASGLFKAFHPDHRRRDAAVARLYPSYGHALPGGFLSHIAGKAFIRTGLRNVDLRIHGIRQGGVRNPNDLRLDGIELAHFHAADWTQWRKAFDQRFASGSYRAALPGTRGKGHHALFAHVLRNEGEAGLRRVFDEVARARPEHLAALHAEGLLRRHDLDLAGALLRHFPGADGAAARRIDSGPPKPLKGARKQPHEISWATGAASTRRAGQGECPHTTDAHDQIFRSGSQSESPQGH